MSEPTLESRAAGDDLHLAQTEIRHLRNTIGALREELEGLQFEKQQSVQRAVADAADEATQLKETAAALRDEMEGLQFEKNRAVQEAVANSTDEITQLKKTAQALRDEMEALRFEKNKAVQEAVANSADEIAFCGRAMIKSWQSTGTSSKGSEARRSTRILFSCRMRVKWR